MIHIIYKTTNKIDGKVYVGAHSTDDLNDGYFGSGKYLKSAVKKYGIENFEREVLFIFDSKEEMFSKERELVNEEFIVCNNTYNIKVGGSGGNPGIVGAFSGKCHSEETKEKLRQAASGKKPNKETKQRLSDNNAIKNNPAVRKKMQDSLTGKTKSEEHRNNLSLAFKGKIMINNGIECKYLSKEDSEAYLQTGWVCGRLPRNKK